MPVPTHRISSKKRIARNPRVFICGPITRTSLARAVLLCMSVLKRALSIMKLGVVKSRKGRLKEVVTSVLEVRVVRKTRRDKL